ncbi:type II toxin-antitoxin system Phd/YefM family antitoxin [Aurantimonas sp. VKM B-3413]|uniref:type II toxin-antitoxin system Phd/YefM family antitoxin n=1 Tax=Aurantimonas sp. VKM B-3413 TaxID=2779401 RepID=UPI001E3E8965|nr:type II toxin-antitoxin system prevent-host-death family antitoxin [Aurantimonas sp. VKM B-3413]
MSDAETRLSELLRLAEAGEDIVLTRDGKPAVRLSPVRHRRNREEFLAAIRQISASASKKAKAGPSAERSQDFLYDENGLPG